MAFKDYTLLGMLSRKKKGPEIKDYAGTRPYGASDVGLGDEVLKPISQQYAKQIQERSRGEGLVGYEPGYRETLESEFNQDLQDDYDEYTRRLTAQSASQGQRGGIPLDLSIRAAKDFGRRKASGLAQIKIGDLEARRADINQATYAQPDLVNLGTDIQGKRAAFDLAEYNNTQPPYIDEPSMLPQILQLVGTGVGAYYGGPAGAAAGSQIGSQAGTTISNAYSKQQQQPQVGRGNQFQYQGSYYDPYASATRRRY
jgi:hypothetical protein